MPAGNSSIEFKVRRVYNCVVHTPNLIRYSNSLRQFEATLQTWTFNPTDWIEIINLQKRRLKISTRDLFEPPILSIFGPYFWPQKGPKKGPKMALERRLKALSGGLGGPRRAPLGPPEGLLRPPLRVLLGLFGRPKRIHSILWIECSIFRIFLQKIQKKVHSILRMKWSRSLFPALVFLKLHTQFCKKARIAGEGSSSLDKNMTPRLYVSERHTKIAPRWFARGSLLFFGLGIESFPRGPFPTGKITILSLTNSSSNDVSFDARRDVLPFKTVIGKITYLERSVSNNLMRNHIFRLLPINHPLWTVVDYLVNPYDKITFEVIFTSLFPENVSYLTR